MPHDHEDAFGHVLVDHHAGRPGPKLMLEVDHGSSDWRCTACERVAPWQELIAGQVEGPTLRVPVCPIVDCAGISWLYFRPA